MSDLGVRVLATDGWPDPEAFAAPPTAEDREGWATADAAARPDRLAALRAAVDAAGAEAFFAVRPEHARYLTGFRLGDGEEKVAGSSGRFLVGSGEVLVLTDSRYTVQAEREAPDASVIEIGYDLPAAWPSLCERLRARRVAVEATHVSHDLWRRLEAAAPEVELVAAEPWLEQARATKTADELERIEAAAAIVDRALATLLPSIRPGVTEHDLALELEWAIRRGGADGLAFGIACLAGPEAALPHGSPGDRPVVAGAVLLFDVGAHVDGYRSDMTRTLFVGDPTAADLAVYGLVAEAQGRAIEALEAAVAAAARTGVPLPSGRAIDAVARGVIEAAGLGDRFGHGTGHGIGLATHELPSLGRQASDEPLPSPTVFSIEPGVYLPGQTGVRIEDLVAIDAATGTVRQLTRFPKGIVRVG